MIIDDFNNIADTAGQYQWFNLVFYDPVHILGDFSVTFEHCKGSEFLQTIGDLGSLDFGNLAERVVTIGLDIGLNYQDYVDQYQAANGWYVPPRPIECLEENF